MDEEDDLLDSLLAAAAEQLEESEDSHDIKDPSVHNEIINSKSKPRSQKNNLKETDIFQFETNLTSTAKSFKNKPNSIIHSGDTDSSDDEGNRNYEDQKYNESGREMKRLLENDNINPSHYGMPKKRVSTWKTTPINGASITANGNTFSSSILDKNNKFGNVSKDEHKKYQDVLLDPIFSMRIINPKISSALLSERMQGRLAVRFSDLARQIFVGNLKDKDWVICGVVVNKSPPKISQKGSEYSIWTLSDLKDDIKTVALFMFNSAHKDLWKTVVGTVIGVLNPSIMDKRDGCKDEATLSVDNAQKVMVFGDSKDFGTCKSMKKNGDKCTAIVNLSRCEFCIYHIKQEYQKCSKRSELQANFAGKGLVNLRNKVLGKNEVFYAGKSYMAIPAKKSKKLETRDNNILENLNNIHGRSDDSVKAKSVTNKKKKGLARHLDVNPAQRAKDLELLKKLGGATNLESKTNFTGVRSDEISLEDSKATALNIINKLKAKKENVESIVVNKNTHYDLKGDLFVNVDNKSTFSGKVSENISLENSKNTALSVISKLKSKKNECLPVSQEENNEENEALMSLEEFEAELNGDELNYSDDGNDINTSPRVSIASKQIETTSNLKGNKLEKNSIKKSVESQTPKSSSKHLNTVEKKTPRQSEYKDLPNDKKSRKTLFDSPKSQSKKSSDSCIINDTLSPKTSQIKLSSSFQSTNHIGSPQVNLMNNGPPIVNRQNTNASFNSSVTKNTLNNDTSELDKMTMGIPMLPCFKKGDFVDLSKPITSRHVDRAKINAMKYIQRNGPIKKIDPNNTKGSALKKRNIQSAFGTDSTDEGNNTKKSKLQESEFISDRFKKMMAMTSRHVDLLEQHDNAEKEKYFNKLEAKEKMEEKMTNTHKVKCKAVKCLQCKYTSFSAADLCKTERHPLKVCAKFNEIGSKLLSRGFIQLEKRHATIYKRVKSALPRRESERKTHPLARHSDILQAVETRMSMLNMTYMRSIENRLICFIPGKVLDEIKSILDLVESNKSPPRTHQLLQELRDLSSMAIEHFDEHILPRCREQLEQRSGSPEKILKELEVVAGSLTPFTKFQGLMYKNLASTSKQPARILIHQQLPHALTGELYKVKKIAKAHKHHISYLTQNSQKLCLKLRKQNNKLRIQAAKLREQDRKLQEQNSKIMEQEVALTDIKKHMDEWDQKYKDLTTELVRARDEILLKASSGSPIMNNAMLSPPILSGNSTQSPSFKTNIKPRMAHILPKSYLGFDVERKRKSSLAPEVPMKRNRSPSAPGLSSPQKASKQVKNVSLNIPDLVTFERNDSNKDTDDALPSRCDGNRAETTSKEKTAIISSFLDNLLTNPLKNGKGRKRKMTEDIDLK